MGRRLRGKWSGEWTCLGCHGSLPTITALVTADGKLTLPREVVGRLGLSAGQALEVQTEGDLLVAWKKSDADPFEKWRGLGQLPAGQTAAEYLRLTRGDRLELALNKFAQDAATLGQAAVFAGLSQAEFLRELGQRRIPLHYGADELAEDLQAVDLLAAR